jgi:3-phenylpropionate/cinnamic acid dioxygenase small subunit
MAKNESGATEPSFYVDDAFYERLIALDKLWRQPEDPPARELERLCEDLIKREARLIDGGQFEQWSRLFSRDCLYWIPTRPDGDPRSEVALEFHDRRRLEDRVARLRSGTAYSQIPPTRTCHLLSNIEMFVVDANQVGARANFLIQTYRLDVHRTLAGWCGYLFVHEEGAWKIAMKKINLIDCDQGQENISFFL